MNMIASIHRPARSLVIAVLWLEAFCPSLQAGHIAALRFRPYSKSIKEIPVGTANSEANRDIISSMREASAGAATTIQKQAASFSAKVKDLASSVTTPVIAHFDGGTTAGVIAVSPGGQVSFAEKDGSGTSIDLGTDLRLRAVPKGYALANGVEATPNDAGAQVSKSVEPFAKTFWADALEAPLGADATAKYQAITTANEALGKTFQQLLAAGAVAHPDTKEIAALQHQLATDDTATLSTIADLYEQTDEGWIKQWLAKVAAVHEQNLKAINGSYVDNFDPEVYDTIAASARASGAIRFVGARDAVVSASLIGDDTIITCQHIVVEKWQTAQKIAKQQHTEKLPIAHYLPNRERRSNIPSDGDPICITELVCTGQPIDDGGVELDYAVFRIDAAGLKAFETKREAEATAKHKPYFPIRPLQISPTPPEYQEPIIVIGHPNGLSKLIHDSTHLLYPSTISPLILQRMKMSHDVALVNTDSAYQFSRKAEWTSFLSRRYQKAAEDSRVYMYEDQPVFGLDSDTFGGDSGGPVISRFTGYLVGVFRGTANYYEDEETAPVNAHHVPDGRAPDFDHHEVAVSLTAILSQLNSDSGALKQGKLPGASFGTPIPQ